MATTEMDLGTLLGTMFRLSRILFWPLLKAVMPLVGIVAVLAAAVGGGAYYLQSQHLLGAIKFDNLSHIPTLIYICSVAICIVVAALSACTAFIAMIQVTEDSIRGRAIPATWDILRRAWRRVGGLIWTGILFCALMLLIWSPNYILIYTILLPVMVLIVFPLWIYVSIRFSFIFEVVALRDKSGIAAFRESRRLVKGRFWKTFAYLFVLNLVIQLAVLVPLFIIQIISAILVPLMQTNQGAIPVVMIIWGCIAFPLILALFFGMILLTATGRTAMFLAWEDSHA